MGADVFLSQLKTVLGKDLLENPLFGASEWRSVWVPSVSMRPCLIRLKQECSFFYLEHLSLTRLTEDALVLSYFLVQKGTYLTLVVRCQIKDTAQVLLSMQDVWRHAQWLEKEISIKTGLIFEMWVAP